MIKTQIGEWKLPVPRELGCRDLSADELKQLAQEDVEAEFP